VLQPQRLFLNVMAISRLFVFILICATGVAVAAPAEEVRQAQARQQMVREITLLGQETAKEAGQATIAPAVLAAMGRVPRHRFVPLGQQNFAYDNRPLPIGYGQTISQPYIVALMTDLLDVRPGQRVLEIGTGSGYQAAVLAELGAEVYSIEIVPPLAQRASALLASLYPQRISTLQGDGYYGWTEHAPFDAIVVTAAASHVPPPLLKQLKPGGRMVIPLGSSFLVQQLMLVEKDTDGRVRSREFAPVRFVPLTGGH
jgi:protein-L-isoaspartate(D-aspartate) O-methyltransferase